LRIRTWHYVTFFESTRTSHLFQDQITSIQNQCNFS